MKLFHYIRRFREIKSFERKLLLISFGLILIYSVLFKLIPLKYYHSWLISENKINAKKCKIDFSFIHCRKAIYRTSLIIPWKLNCVVKSLTYKYLLNLSGIKSRIKIKTYKDASFNLKLHACISLSNSYKI